MLYHRSFQYKNEANIFFKEFEKNVLEDIESENKSDK